jgi:hypothetical protein
MRLTLLSLPALLLLSGSALATPTIHFGANNGEPKSPGFVTAARIVQGATVGSKKTDATVLFAQKNPLTGRSQAVLYPGGQTKQRGVTVVEERALVDGAWKTVAKTTVSDLRAPAGADKVTRLRSAIQRFGTQTGPVAITHHPARSSSPAPTLLKVTDPQGKVSFAPVAK